MKHIHPARAFIALGSFLFFPMYGHAKNKTYLATRPLGTYTAFTGTRNATHERNKTKDGQVRATSFTMFSGQPSNQRRYFFFEGKTHLFIGQKGDIDNRYITFNEETSTSLTGTLSITPRQRSYGVVIHYDQHLDDILKSLTLSAYAPIAHTRNDMNINIAGATNSSTSSKTIADYFRGDSMFTVTHNDGTLQTLQEPLQFGKINQSSSKTGVADLHVLLGYQVFSDNATSIDVTGKLVVPTSSSPRSRNLFEATLGNAAHWSVGVDASATYAFSGHFHVHGTLEYQYLFPDIQRRIIGLKNSNGVKLNFGHYQLLGKVNAPLVLPAANVLALPVKVSPHNSISASIRTIYGYRGFTFEGGYSGWYRDAESVKARFDWDNDAYGFVGADYAADIVTFSGTTRVLTNFTSARSNLSNTIQSMEPSGISAATQGTIQQSQLDLSAAATPASITSTFFGSVSYLWQHKRHTITGGGGMAYEFSRNAAAVEKALLWAWADITF